MEKWEKNTHSGHFSVTCTDTLEPVLVQVLQNRTCTDTGAEQVRYTLLYFDQFSYFSHNFLISYPI